MEETSCSGKIVFLGTGDPEGIPVPFCSCEVCSQGRICRLRSSVWVQSQGKNFIIDTGPDLRTQLLRYRVPRLDGVFLTHPHYDHIGGIDDLRSWYITHLESVPIILSSFTYDYLCKTKEHLVQKETPNNSLAASLRYTILNEKCGEQEFLGIPFTYVSYFQKNCRVTGYRFGDLAYLTDMSHYDEQIVDYLQGVNTIIVSASLGVLPKAFGSRTPSHLTLEQADLLMEKVGASRLVITHVSHYLHKVLEKDVTRECAYDGMELLWT
ncbi:MBL fold metallo-hydrolase [Chlamydia trachomatis]|uniref:MBL fold metallo-hydrolase n=1 Tax=Chlamydia trachomatis TaxID=813 RepID=UPI0002A8480F|nr:MBL fold metallo-hydrolase [Chlamydia trachomatis]CCP62416.1 putative hydrolase [Chlamydia trachomatis L1/440/LN]CCP66865.1 putative hydrolase [Chlamydia trachomatis L3/404/LN]